VIRRGEKYSSPLPNLASKHTTPASVAIDAHYAINLINERWNFDRYAKLCAFIQMTPYELASLVMMPHSWINEYRRTKLMPAKSAARPICLLLTIVEAHWLRNYSRDIVADPFPKL
jgi:hypothetical protein